MEINDDTGGPHDPAAMQQAAAGTCADHWRSAGELVLRGYHVYLHLLLLDGRLLVVVAGLLPFLGLLSFRPAI